MTVLKLKTAHSFSNSWTCIAIFVCLASTPLVGNAAEHVAPSGSSEIPIKTILWQLVNLSLLFGGAFYFLKKSVKDFFIERKEQYIIAAKKSQQAQIEAEKLLYEIQHKFRELETSKQQNMEEARQEALRVREQLIEEALETAKRVIGEAKSTVELEIGKAQIAIKQKLLFDSLEMARSFLTKDIGNNDHQKLQTEFIHNVEVGL